MHPDAQTWQDCYFVLFYLFWGVIEIIYRCNFQTIKNYNISLRNYVSYLCLLDFAKQWSRSF
jgi:hypothetical protein